MAGFVISIDFELLWGVHDVRSDEYHYNIKKVHEVVPEIIRLFDNYGIKSTWATVGYIAAMDLTDFEKISGKVSHPSYFDENLSPIVKRLANTIPDSDLLFAPNLLKTIVQSVNTELASHTLSHYYALEDGQTKEQFRSDINVFKSLFLQRLGVDVVSIIFPRNQENPEYNEVLVNEGITHFRGNPRHWAYRAESRSGRSSLKRIYRLVDAYLPLTRDFECESYKDESGLMNVPSTIFLRPYNKLFSLLEPLKIARIKSAMTLAAKNKQLFHLWWHPHNFSKNLNQNLANVESLLKHYVDLKIRYDWPNVTMKDFNGNDY